MENSFGIANYFIGKSIETGVELTPMKLIKLVYLSHGWYLGINGEPLIAEPIQAWKYGPVIEDLYHFFKRFGASQITSYATNDPLRVNFFEIEKKAILPFLDRIWDVYGNYTGMQLSTITHEPGSPWDKIWNKRDGTAYAGMIIPNQVIREFYESKVHENEPG